MPSSWAMYGASSRARECRVASALSAAAVSVFTLVDYTESTGSSQDRAAAVVRVGSASAAGNPEPLRLGVVGRLAGTEVLGLESGDSDFCVGDSAIFEHRARLHAA